MRKRSLVVAAVIAACGMTALFAPACAQDRKEVPTAGTGSAQGGLDPAGGGGSGEGGSGGSGDGGHGGRNGDGGSGGAGVGGGPETLPECACLLDTSVTNACGTCVSFGVVDECGELYGACQADGDCTAVDNCVLDEKCTTGACLDACRDLGTPESLDTFDAMYACACNLCRDDCDNGDACR